MSADLADAHHVASRLMHESLIDKTLIAATESPVRAILPNLNVIQIGGLSIMDRGHTAVLPLLDEIVANQERHAQVIGVGPGVRARHILSAGLDLGLPAGALATLAANSRSRCARRDAAHRPIDEEPAQVRRRHERGARRAWFHRE